MRRSLSSTAKRSTDVSLKVNEAKPREKWWRGGGTADAAVSVAVAPAAASIAATAPLERFRRPQLVVATHDRGRKTVSE